MHRNLIALVCGCLVALGSLAAPANDAELEFWRSTERIGTADAYRAYLRAYSNGHFAPLARAALDKADLPSPAATEDRLNEFTGPAQSSAVSFKLGDRFAGPTTIAIGSLGTKKQLVLPSGEWVALAAFDGTSGRVDPADTTTLAFGKFNARRLTAMLQMTVNREAVTDRAVDWSGIDECQESQANRLHEWKKSQTAWLRECVAVRYAPTIVTASGETNVSLGRLGARAQGGAIITDMVFADDVNGYLHVRRIDWPQLALGEEGGDAARWTPQAVAAAPPRAAYVKGLIAWADAYRGVAAEGFRGRISRVEPVRGIPVSTFESAQR